MPWPVLAALLLVVSLTAGGGGEHLLFASPLPDFKHRPVNLSAAAAAAAPPVVIIPGLSEFSQMFVCKKGETVMTVNELRDSSQAAV